MPFLKSLLDTDYYKFTQGQLIFNNFSTIITEHVFINRNNYQDFTPFIAEIKDTIKQLCDLKIKKDEIIFLKSQQVFKDSYIEFLRLLHLNAEHIIIENNDNFTLKIQGPFYLTIFFEQLLSIISEIYNKNNYPNVDYDSGIQNLEKKIKIVKNTPGFIFSDFGTRRRFSHMWHRRVIEYILKNIDSNTFIGTSNVLFAKEYSIKPIGTQAHEIFMLSQQLGVRVRDSQKYMLQKWVDEYRGSLGIALTDTIGIDAFLKDFDLYFSKLYDGVRHDSGCPYTWASKICKHYKAFKIDPNTKTLVFSDGLDFEKAVAILTYCKETLGTTNVSFGIGTNLTNDIPESKPLSIVIKMQKCNGQPVAKISDEPSKAQCQDPEFLSYLKKVFEVK